MWDYLSDKNVSLFCAVLNAVFCISAFFSGQWFAFFLCGFFACYCYRNYYLAHTR